MEYFVQQLVNGLTFGSIYGLIAIGCTMVYGISMINFAHGDIFMLGGFAALIVFLLLTTIFAGLPVVLLLLVMIAAAMSYSSQTATVLIPSSLAARKTRMAIPVSIDPE